MSAQRVRIEQRPAAEILKIECARLWVCEVSGNLNLHANKNIKTVAYRQLSAQSLGANRIMRSVVIKAQFECFTLKKKKNIS